MTSVGLAQCYICFLSASAAAPFSSPEVPEPDPRWRYRVELDMCTERIEQKVIEWEQAREAGDHKGMAQRKSQIAVQLKSLCAARMRFYEFGRTNVANLSAGAKRSWEAVRDICERQTMESRIPDSEKLPPPEILRALKKERLDVGGYLATPLSQSALITTGRWNRVPMPQAPQPAPHSEESNHK